MGGRRCHTMAQAEAVLHMTVTEPHVYIQVSFAPRTDPTTAARTEQSPPRKPPVHSHWPRMQTPWPEHMPRSAQLFTGCTRSDRQALQHSAGAIGTNSVSKVILHQTRHRKLEPHG